MSHLTCPADAVYLPTEEYLSAYKNAENNLQQIFRVDEWGIGYEPCSTFHFTHMKHPMENYGTVNELLNYPFPRVEKNNPALKNEVKRLKEQDYYVMGNVVSFIFEKAWHLRGIESLLIDFYENEEFAAVLLDRILEIKTEMALELVKAGVDQINLGDDIGTQKSMIMRPEMWRKWIKPRLAGFISSIKAKGKVNIFYHSDGCIEPVINDLTEIGVDILNPVQPECMNPFVLKEQFGHVLSFWGVMGCQSTMRFGTAAQVESETKKYIDRVGENGGLVLGLMSVEPDIPWENIIAFFNTVENY
ncbi:MAG: uroporphyrinogen decarboxylase family protein [bacterium]|nr:uroporphyrinogen decarboxylase family protein [bacterium]